MSAILILLQQIVAASPRWIEAGLDVWETWQNVERVIAENKVVGDADWEALDATVRERKAAFDEAAKG